MAMVMCVGGRAPAGASKHSLSVNIWAQDTTFLSAIPRALSHQRMKDACPRDMWRTWLLLQWLLHVTTVCNWKLGPAALNVNYALGSEDVRNCCQESFKCLKE